jgi:DNA-binding IclR family transcriptional regulator
VSTADRVFELLQNGFTGICTELGDELGVNKSTVYQALLDLRSAGKAHVIGTKQVSVGGRGKRRADVWALCVARVDNLPISTVERAIASMPQLQRIWFQCMEGAEVAV